MSCICGTILKNGVVLGCKNQNNKVVGVMCCRIPGNTSSTRKEGFANFFRYGLPPPLLYAFSWGSQPAKRFQSLSNIKKTSKYLNKKYNQQYWYIEAIGILPEYRGQGMFARFLESVFSVADDCGYPVYLETQSARNENIYKKFGFETIEKKNIASVGCTEEQYVWFMRRA